MFPSFIGILDIQSWWEVPSIAYFCSLFRTAFNLLDFDIEELEEALLTDGTEDSSSSLLTELIVRLLNGCLGNNDISAFNYQMYLRRLFRRKCQETGRCNPFNTDIDFQFLPLRTKVEILYALCDFRLDADDVFELFKNLDAESLRVEPLGWDDNDSAYWYFYGTRLYREDILKKPKSKSKKKKSKKRGWFYGDDWLDDDECERVWQVVCFTEEDWSHLTEKFSKATSKEEKELYRSLSQNFLPEIPRLFQEKERLQRKRLLELAPRRTSSRVLQKIKQKEEETKQATNEIKEEEGRQEVPDLARENRAKRRNLLRSKSFTSESSEEITSPKQEMPLKESKRSKGHEKKSKHSSEIQKDEPMLEPLVKTGRKTNNSLASATGQIVIPDSDEPISSTRKKLKTSQIFSQTDEDIQTDMYKVLKQLTAHDDAWPFMDPVEEEYAPNYYAVIRRPMDLRKMEDRLDSGYYTDFSMFKADFKLIVNNCRLYNGQDNEYTMMVDNLQTAFDRLTEKYIHRLSSSDEEIAVEFQLPTPSRKHKLKSSESPSHHKRKKRKSHSDTGEPKSSSSDILHKEKQEGDALSDKEIKHSKESHKSKQNKGKKKHKRHHRHGKHSKNHKKNSHRSHRSKHAGSTKSKHGKKQKHSKNKDSKKSKQKKKKNKHHESETADIMKRSASQESLESSNRSRSASPLPSIHTPTPSPTELDQSEPPEQLTDPEFYKDKYDKIKERRRNAAKDAWESLFDFKQKTGDKQKQNFYIPEKDKNQKLKETIEKLKAKNEKYKDSAMYSSLFTASPITGNKASDSNDVQESKSKGENSDEDEGEKLKHKIAVKDKKKNSAKNESASEALEQAVKDISKWFDDAPKVPIMSSSCDSPAQTISTEEHDNSRLDDEFSQGDKPSLARKDLSRKRRSSREPKLLKRREIQRTIDRLQPGKSKGNLLTNLSNKNTEKIEEITLLGPQIKVRDPLKSEESSPKLSLGSVLPTVEFTLGNDHNFGNNENTNTKVDDPKETGKLMEIAEDKKLEEAPAEKKAEELSVQVTKKDAEVETEPQITIKPNQEKATPNLSAWFKAFGTPKNTTAVLPKKKIEGVENEEKVSDTCNDVKPGSPKNPTKYDIQADIESPLPDGRESPLPSTLTTPIQRRTSTGSSISERSSFSQDLDSPRHQMSHTSPLIQSPASPRTEDFQKITYPIINGTVRAGFYHDTTSIKSSPEKSCSPREASQSPYSPYSQHVYVSNSITGSSTPNYFVDHNKGSLPTYNQNPYYEPKNSVSSTNKSLRVHDDYTTLGPNSYPQNQYTGPFSSTYSPYSQSQSSNYTQMEQNSPQSSTSNTSTAPPTATQLIADTKATLFPVKKRTYNEQDHSTVSTLKVAENKDETGTKLNKSDCQKMTQLSHTISTTTSLTSVDDIALALSEKSELVKLNNLRETKIVEVTSDNRDPIKFNKNDDVHDHKKDVNIIESNKPVGMLKKDNVDMVNMGYLNPDSDRRNNNGEVNEGEYSKEVNKPNITMQSKGYDIDTIAINLGFSSQTMQNTLPKPSINISNIPPAHSQERSNNEIGLNQNIVHAHHNQFDSMASNFSLSDIDLANKKLFGCNTSAALDYGNWKMANPIRKQDVLPSDYSTNYNINNAEKTKSEVNVTLNTVNYNKSIQNQQYSSYNVARPSVAHRPQELPHNLPGELRIPNLRGLLKSDHMSVSSPINDNLIPKNTDTIAKSQKSDKLVQNHPLVNSNPYKTPYNNPTTLPLDNLHNLPNIPQMLERYSDDRYLTSFATNSPSMYHEKPFQMAQMFNKSVSSGVHLVTSNVSIYTQSPISMSKDISMYKTSNALTTQTDTKPKTKRKRTSESKQTAQVGGNQTYHQTSCNTDVLSSVKTSMMPTSTFNFGTSTNMALGSGLYTDNGSFSIEDFRNTATANQLMAANYMVAAVAHQQRNNVEANTDKLVKPAHQNSSHTSSFPFIGHSQVRAGYPFVGSDPTSPLYQQYLQRQEELLRQTGAQIMSLYPPGYPSSLGVRQSYDSINRPSWL